MSRESTFTSGGGGSTARARLGTRWCSRWMSSSASPRSIVSRWLSRASEASSFSTNLAILVLEMSERRLVAARKLEPLDLVGQSFDHGIELVGHALAAPIARLERVGEHRDPVLERGESAAAAGAGGLIDLAGKGAHFLGQAGQRVIRGHMGDDAPHRDDCAFELPERGRILRVARDKVDFLRKLLHCSIDADEVLGRRQCPQRIAHLGEPALDAGHRGPIGAGVAGVVDAIGELAHLAFEGLDRLARHGFLQHDADLGEIVAQHVDGFVEPAGLPERLDLRIDLTQVAARGRIAPACVRAAASRTAPAHERRMNGGIAGGDRGIAVERALAVRDLHQRLVERRRRIDGRARFFAVEIGDRAIDRIHALLDLGLG